jgi:hypothetical protein
MKLKRVKIYHGDDKKVVSIPYELKASELREQLTKMFQIQVNESIRGMESKKRGTPFSLEDFIRQSRSGGSYYIMVNKKYNTEPKDDSKHLELTI